MAAAKKRGLGRGLDALLGGDGEGSPSVIGQEGELRMLPIQQIQPGKYQPRRHWNDEALDELAASIRSQGLIQPVVVRSLGKDSYELIAGERRWRAAQRAQLAELPALVKVVPEASVPAMALIENIQREDLNPLEEARALERLIAEFGLTHQQVASAVGRSRAAVTNLLRLLELAPEVCTLLEERAIDMGHARALLGLENRRKQIEVAALVAKKGLSVRDTEALVRRLSEPQGPKGGDGGTGNSKDPNVRRLEEELGGKLGARVQIQHGAGGRGKVIVNYNNLEELDGILAHIT